MSTKAQSVLEQFKALPLEEQREVRNAILRQATSVQRSGSRRSIADIAGKYHAQPDRDAKDHDAGFAEAVLRNRLGS